MEVATLILSHAMHLGTFAIAKMLSCLKGILCVYETMGSLSETCWKYIELMRPSRVGSEGLDV